MWVEQRKPLFCAKITYFCHCYYCVCQFQTITLNNEIILILWLLKQYLYASLRTSIKKLIWIVILKIQSFGKVMYDLRLWFLDARETLNFSWKSIAPHSFPMNNFCVLSFIENILSVGLILNNHNKVSEKNIDFFHASKEINLNYSSVNWIELNSCNISWWHNKMLYDNRNYISVLQIYNFV